MAAEKNSWVQPTPYYYSESRNQPNEFNRQLKSECGPASLLIFRLSSVVKVGSKWTAIHCEMQCTELTRCTWFGSSLSFVGETNWITILSAQFQSNNLQPHLHLDSGEIRDVEEEATSKEIPLDSKIATANVDNKRQRQRGRQWDRQERNTFAYNNTTTDEPIEMANCYFNNCIFIRPTIRPIKTSALRISSPGRDR